MDADDVDLAERPVLETAGDKRFDRVEDLAVPSRPASALFGEIAQDFNEGFREEVR